jgi:hypothetical protein
MIPKSGNRFSERIVPRLKEHDPENRLQLFRKDHAQLITKLKMTSLVDAIRSLHRRIVSDAA